MLRAEALTLESCRMMLLPNLSCVNSPRAGGTRGRMAASGRGFTLIEILMVIAVIAILSALGLAVTSRVISLNRAKTSENVVRALDQLLEGYVGAKGGLPPAIVSTTGSAALRIGTTTDAAVANARIYLPMIDGRFAGDTATARARTFPIAPGDSGSGTSGLFDVERDPPQPSTAIFLLAVKQAMGDLGVLNTLDSRFLRTQEATAWGWRDDEEDVRQFGFVQRDQNPPLYGPTVRDAFGRAIRFAHPAFQGGFGPYYVPGTGLVSTREGIDFARVSAFTELATGLTGASRSGAFTRSAMPFDPGDPTLRNGTPVGDGDEGSGPSRKPYFYATGPSGNPGDRSGNTYSVKPSHPAETALIPLD